MVEMTDKKDEEMELERLAEDIKKEVDATIEEIRMVVLNRYRGNPKGDIIWIALARIEALEFWIKTLEQALGAYAEILKKFKKRMDNLNSFVHSTLSPVKERGYFLGAADENAAFDLTTIQSDMLSEWKEMSSLETKLVLELAKLEEEVITRKQKIIDLWEKAKATP